MNKYRAKKVEYDGIRFDSQKEAKRYRELKLMESAGEITNLELQKRFELIPSQYQNGKCVERSCNYVADFVYQRNGETVVEDVKGCKDSAAYSIYTIKRKLMLEKYGVRVNEC